MTWTVWWWDERDIEHMPVPLSRTFDTKREALKFAQEMTDDPPDWLGFVKVFRSDNEGYVAYRWTRSPRPEDRAPQIASGYRPPGSDKHVARRVLLGLAIAALLIVGILNILIYAR